MGLSTSCRTVDDTGASAEPEGITGGAPSLPVGMRPPVLPPRIGELEEKLALAHNAFHHESQVPPRGPEICVLY